MGTLWITYAWKDNEEGDFDYLVASLRAEGITARYDKVALVPGQHLWAQIAERITKDDVDGWAYLLTPNSVNRQAPREELELALNRALSEKGAGFPLIGLLHNVTMDTVPASLRIRLCVNLASPNWIEEVRGALERRSPSVPTPAAAPIRVGAHNNYMGQLGHTAFEVRPRFGEMRFWRFGWLAEGPSPARWGTGLAGGGGVGTVLRDYVEGTVDISGEGYRFVGSGDPLSAASSAYLIFEGPVPRRLVFGVATSSNGHPAEWWPLATGS